MAPLWSNVGSKKRSATVDRADARGDGVEQERLGGEGADGALDRDQTFSGRNQRYPVDRDAGQISRRSRYGSCRGPASEEDRTDTAAGSRYLAAHHDSCATAHSRI